MSRLRFESRTVLLGDERDGAIALLAPGVGWWDDPPPDGRRLGPGSPVGCLQTLNSRFELVLGDGLAGQVRGVGAPARRAVAHGTILFHLVRIEAGAAMSPALGAATTAPLQRGTHAVVAPTDGVFYRRGAPDAPPLVAEGQRIRTGQPVGLIEVMKTFNQVLYGGPGLPDEATVLELPVQDGAEVRAGAILVVLR